MRSVIDNDYLTVVSRLLIGGIFISASIYKIIDPGAFAKTIWYYHIVPGAWINLVALVIPWLELFCGLTLILGIFYLGAVFWANLMTIGFIVVLASTIVRGLDIDCGCFRAAQSATEPAWNALFFDVVMLVFTVQMLLSNSRKWRLQRSG